RNLKIFYAINSATRFTERDRAVARIIRPHLIQAFENVLQFTDARAIAVLSAHTFRSGTHGLIMADFSGRIIHATEQASDHLSQARQAEGGETDALAANETLPPRMLAWLSRMGREEGGNHPPLELEMPGCSVVFRGAVVDKRHWVIASQAQDMRALADVFRRIYHLSLRQADVLLWLSRGKSNADIATILNISGRTVAKHVEHIFGKLGVENRLAASHKAIDLLGG
ncbi:MAG: LuxR family transcriptional regulator, partial [Verrucomicrobiaceae bacterium]